MKVLSEEESRHLHPLGKGRLTLVHVMLGQLKLGQSLVIEKKDWFTKHPPYKVVRTAAKNFKYQFTYGRMPDGSGWLVKRMA